MQSDAMADGDLVFEDRRMCLRSDVYHRHVLDIRSRTDANVIYVAANNGTKPNARVLADLNVPDDSCVVCHVDAWMDMRKFAFEISDHLACEFAAKRPNKLL